MLLNLRRNRASPLKLEVPLVTVSRNARFPLLSLVTLLLTALYLPRLTQAYPAPLPIVLRAGIGVVVPPTLRPVVLSLPRSEISKHLSTLLKNMFGPFLLPRTNSPLVIPLRKQ